MEKSILYFDRPGPENTERLMALAKERAWELGINDVIVATTHGGTALKVLEAFPGANIVAVTISEGYKDRGWCITESERAALIEKGIKVLTATHALGDGVASAFAEKYGGKPMEEVVRDAFYRFGQGMKVCVEIVLMVADAGLIPMDDEVMAIAGTGDGADTCIVVKPAYPRKFFELEIREIVAKPRNINA
ncbi:MAG: hypothetical protein JSV27_09855 [Candidatus Bathyarchaeota archaeon]|nr:MAG: hypothetical protein JSV27_09855 [Candidatus Bathyarchaeota archaeon]